MKIASNALLLVASTLTLSCFASSAQALNLVTNGDFELTSNGPDKQVSYNTDLTGWTLPAPGNSYTFVFSSGVADTVGAVGQYGNLKLWGPGTRVANGLTPESPAGGNFIAFDSAFQNPRGATLSQTIRGLTAGAQYEVSFWEAAAQQHGYDGDTYDQWEVTFGNRTQLGTAFTIPNHGFSGWKKTTMTFTAASATQTLSFFATGGPEGLPPFALLDGVSVTAVPEPLTILGVATAVGFGARMKRRLAQVKSRGEKK